MPAIFGSDQGNHLFPPGPCEIAVATKETSSTGIQNLDYEFLGTTREGGRAQEILYTGNIPADYAGSDGMPADIRLSGKGIVVVCQVQNFNPYTMMRLKSRFYGGVNGYNSLGRIDKHDIGGLLIQEMRYISLCIRSLNASTGGKYQHNEAGLWVPCCFPSGELGWDYAAREQVYSLTFLGVTYMNMNFTGGGAAEEDPQNLGVGYNAGLLYSINRAHIDQIWANVENLLA